MGSISETRVLKCGVIGAGIAGLGAAIALSRAGHHVTVYERSRLKHETGAAITLTPNANRVLDHWGLDAVKLEETLKLQTRRFFEETLECRMEDNFEGMRETYGHNFNAYHRADLHKGLFDLAKGRSSVEFMLGMEIEEVDYEAGILTLSEGIRVQKDLIVLADGIKSRFVRAISGSVMSTQKTGKSVFRTLIPMERIMADERCRTIYENQLSGFADCGPSKSGTLMVTYPCRSDKVLNVAVFHNTRAHLEDAEDWDSSATVEDALEVLEGFHPAWRAIVSHADFMNVYSVGFREGTSNMAKGRTIIIGDAAHPMMPTHAQGGCMALEDAAALEVLFTDLSFNESVQNRLKLFNQLRLPRCATTQILSNAMFYRATTDKTEAIRKYYQGPLPLPDTRMLPKAFRDFFFAYDVIYEAQVALKYKSTPEGIPDGAIQHFGFRH